MDQLYIFQVEHYHVINASNTKIKYRIVYEENNWAIYDGNGKRSSTNGTWLFIEEDYELHNDTMFKAADVLFKVHIGDKYNNMD